VAVVPPTRRDAASGSRRLREPAGLAPPAALPPDGRRRRPPGGAGAARLRRGPGRPGATADLAAVPRPVPAGTGQPADLVAHHRGPLLRAGAGGRLARAARRGLAAGRAVPGARGLVEPDRCPRRPRCQPPARPPRPVRPGRRRRGPLPRRPSRGTVPTPAAADGSRCSPGPAARPRRHRHVPRGHLPVRHGGVPSPSGAPGRRPGHRRARRADHLRRPRPSLRAPAAGVAGLHQLQPLPLALPDHRPGPRAARPPPADRPRRPGRAQPGARGGRGVRCAPPTGGGARRASPGARRRPTGPPARTSP
jgi:hypothetical protein